MSVPRALADPARFFTSGSQMHAVFGAKEVN